MDNNEDFLRQWQDSLDKESAQIASALQANHSDWDKQSNTLSSAAIAFSFSFLVINNPQILWSFWCAMFCFGVSVAISGLNFMFADNGLNMSRKLNEQGSLHRIKMQGVLRESNRAISQFNTDDLKAITKAEHRQLAKMQKAEEEYQAESKEPHARRDKNSDLVSRLNKVRTAGFLIGLFLIAIYVSANFNNLATKQTNSASTNHHQTHYCLNVGSSEHVNVLCPYKLQTATSHPIETKSKTSIKQPVVIEKQQSKKPTD
jgi:hypothetical protein